MDILQTIKNKAKEKKSKILITEGWDERVLQAVDQLIQEDVADFILVGKEEEIKDNMKKLNLSLNVEIIDPEKFDKKDQLVKKLVELRKHKGMTEEKAKSILDIMAPLL